MSPSNIHHINSDAVDIISPELDKSIIEVSKNALKAGELLKIQAVQKDGQWFALNSAQLDLCRRLEDEGSCQVVLVDPVPATEVPEDVRRMMRVPVDRDRFNRKTTVARTGNGEPETDNSSHTAEVLEGQGGTNVVGCGGKGYRMLDQTDPLDHPTMTTKVLSQAGPVDHDDDVLMQRQSNGEVHQGQTIREATDDSSDDEDSSDSECDWSDEGDESGSEDDHARLADTSDEMSCLL